jgi:hypothetical protein
MVNALLPRADSGNKEPPVADLNSPRERRPRGPVNISLLHLNLLAKLVGDVLHLNALFLEFHNGCLLLRDLFVGLAFLPGVECGLDA